MSKSFKQEVISTQAKRLYISDIPYNLVMLLSQDLIVEYAAEEYRNSDRVDANTKPKRKLSKGRKERI